jgi:hypothetical protein
VSQKIRETLLTVFNAAVTPACLLAVLAIWPVSNLIRGRRTSY